MIIRIHPQNPEQQKINLIADLLDKDGLIIIPTDSVYAMCCSLKSKKAFERLCHYKGVKPKAAFFTLLFSDLSHLANYTKQFDKAVYKIINKNTPGPFTFILEAAGNLPPIFAETKKTIGFRVPENHICRELVMAKDTPLVATSLKWNLGVDDQDESQLADEYYTDPELIYEHHKNRVDAVIDGGWGLNMASTVVDLTSGEPEIIRQGLGDLVL
jgi:tRNA threonylcarbamoyl adenosine modification protein (Sua5/YciO/YrdC/YwlC family)